MIQSAETHRKLAVFHFILQKEGFATLSEVGKLISTYMYTRFLLVDCRV